jgi:putative SOS response-associated peptidase YedK
MCVNFRPSTRETIKQNFDLDIPFDYRSETWKDYTAPIIRQHEGQRIAEPAHFGLIPPWCKSSLDAKKLTSGTMNARSETVAEKPSFKNAWRKSHFCLVPMSEFYEPCYESGKAVRYRVGLADDTDFAVAGIWSWWTDPETTEGMASFSMLTLNADSHPVLNRLHKPDDEKRSLFIVPPNEYNLWLGASPEEARAMLMLLPPERFAIAPAPKAPSKSIPHSPLHPGE